MREPVPITLGARATNCHHAAMIKLLRIALAGVALVALTAGAAAEAPCYLFTSFRGNGEDGLHLALSRDGFTWTALNKDRPFLKSTVGGGLMRDSCLARGPDGVFHLVWTTGWDVRQGAEFGYASSSNLIAWTTPRGIPVLQDEPGARNVWAPEVFYDAAAKRWVIFWSTTITGRFPETAGTGDNNHRFYYVTTADFRTFSPTRLLHDPGFNCIDATFIEDGGRLRLIFKDERKIPLKKNLRWAAAASPTGPFGPASEPFTGPWAEGPSAIRIGEWVYVYFDHYVAPHYYGAVRTKDWVTWEDVSKQMIFPNDMRHGTVLTIPGDIARALANHARPAAQPQ